MHLPWVVEVLTTLLHLSLFLFFSGLLIYLFNTDHTVFASVIWWVALTVGLYAGVTLMPIFRHDSPYYTPLTSSVWLVYAGVVYKALSVLLSISVVYADGGSGGPQSGELDRYREWSRRGVEKAAEDTALDRSLEVDVRILRWIIDALGEDDALERLFEALPGFLDPKVVPLHGFVLVHESGTVWSKLLQAMSGFLDRTLTSNSVSVSVKIRRLTICLDAASHLRVESPLLSNLVLGNWHESTQSVEVGHFLRRWCKEKSERGAGEIGAIVARIVVSTQKRDGRWISLAKDQFRLPDRIFDDNLSHGNSVLLAILIHVNRQAVRSGSWTPEILSALSQFDIQNTLAELQHDFCTLWNEIVQGAQEGGAYSTPVFILKRIRRLYIALHQGTSAVPTRFSLSTDDHDDILYQPSSYPLCNIANHRPDSTAHAPVTTSLSVPQRDPVVLPPISPLITPNIHSSPSSNRERTGPLGDLSDLSLIHVDGLRRPIPSASHRITATSSDFVMAGKTHGNTDISAISGTTNPITRSASGDPLRRFDETEILPSSTMFHSPRTPISMPTLSPVPIPAIHPSPLASNDTRTEFTHTIGIPSGSSTLPRRLSFSPLDSAVSHQHATPKVGTIGAHNDTQGPNSSPMEVSHHSREPELSASGTATNSLQHEPLPV
ncbi:hypothetical protein BC827DRAFT_512664 [Russula dissimulans]|nr:hypothetical protein BC827DRAFT_512664 [Russula dissimulans]